MFEAESLDTWAHVRDDGLMSDWFAICYDGFGMELFGPFDTEDDARRYIAWNRSESDEWDVQQPISPVVR